MLLKCCAIILIFSSKNILLCDANDDNDGKNNALKDTANYKKLVCTNINVTRKFRRNNNNETLPPTPNPILSLLPNVTANRIKLEGDYDKDRFLTKYFAITCDGYVLEIFRLSFAENRTKHCPVLLFTGMFQSSDRFLNQSEEQSLVFLLQDLGYDVWLGNARGNKYGRHHLYLEPDSDEKHDFFNYSYEEIGYYDIAAAVNMIHNMTNVKKMHFIGHSLGATAFLVLNSLRPEYNAFFDRAYLLAPLAYQRYFPNNDLKREIYYLEKTYEELSKAGIVEIFPYNLTDENPTFLPEDCLGDKKYEKICTQLSIKRIMGLSKKGNTRENTRGGSIKQLAHLAQNIHSGTFTRWFYKEESDNQKMYGTKSPPEYNLSLVTVPTTIFYSAGDEYVARKDVDTLSKKISNATTRKVERKNFKHNDFITGPDVLFHVYSVIVDELPENPGPIPKEKNAKRPHGEFKFSMKWLLILMLGGGATIFFTVTAVKKLNKIEPKQNEET